MPLRTKPAHEFRLGRIKTTIWANQSTTGEMWFNVELVRLYSESDKWHESTSFGRDDLPLVAKAADMAFRLDLVAIAIRFLGTGRADGWTKQRVAPTRPSAPLDDLMTP